MIGIFKDIKKPLDNDNDTDAFYKYDKTQILPRIQEFLNNTSPEGIKK